jgi:hypothetical protein
MEHWQFWVAVGGLAFTVSATIIGTTFRLTVWLTKQFDALKESTAGALTAHEREDNRRHEENLERFGEINGSLAKLELRLNGAGRRS